MALSSELRTALERGRSRPRSFTRNGISRNGSRALLQERNDTVPADDPDDSIDPDDSGPRLSVTFNEQPVAEIYALPVAQTEQTPGRDPHTLEQSSAPQSPPGATATAAGTPAMPGLLDPVVLRTMPPQVAAFMLYEPRDPPPWRYRETGAEREFRERCESDGAWCG
jgi:hypothetical protein